jgi:hypothetical protein
LEKRRLAERVTESMTFAPASRSGVHRGPLPSFAKKLNSAGVPWYKDKSHLEGVTTNFLGSPLEGPAAAERERQFDGLPQYITSVPPEYDPSLRHTVRDVALHGATHTSTAKFGETSSGMGSKTVRLIRDGVLREDEETDAAAGDPFKLRVVDPRKLGRYLRKNGLQLPEKPVKFNPWETAKQEAATLDPTAFRPSFSVDSNGNSRPAHTVHKNLSNWSNGLSGPKVDKTAVLQNSMSGRGWSTAVIEYKNHLEGTDDKLDETGKVRLVDPKAYDPMYSSFTKDNIFRDEFVKGNVGFHPKNATQNDKPPRRTSVYGMAVALAASVADGGLHSSISSPTRAAAAPAAGGGGGGVSLSSDAALPPITMPPGTGSHADGRPYESVMTPGGTWAGTSRSARSSTSAGLSGIGGMGGGGAVGFGHGHHMAHKKPTRRAEVASPPRTLVDTLAQLGSSGNRSTLVGNGGMAVPPGLGTGGVRTGGFGVRR